MTLNDKVRALLLLPRLASVVAGMATGGGGG